MASASRTEGSGSRLIVTRDEAPARPAGKDPVGYGLGGVATVIQGIASLVLFLAPKLAGLGPEASDVCYATGGGTALTTTLTAIMARCLCKRAAVADLESAVHDVQVVNGAVASETEALQKEVADLKALRDGLQSSLEQERALSLKTKGDLDAALHEVERLKPELDTVKGKLQEFQILVSRAEGAAGSLKTQVEAFSLGDTDQKIEALTRGIDGLKLSVTDGDAQRELEELARQVQAFQASTEERKLLVREVGQTISALILDLEAKKELLAKAQEENRTLADTRSKLEETERGFHEVEQQFTDLLGKYTLVTTQLRELEPRLKEYEAWLEARSKDGSDSK